MNENETGPARPAMGKGSTYTPQETQLARRMARELGYDGEDGPRFYPYARAALRAQDKLKAAINDVRPHT